MGKLGSVLALFLVFSLTKPLPLAASEFKSAGNDYREFLLRRASEKRLWEQRHWLLLGHYKENIWGGYESQEDGSDFFASPTGKHDPQAELVATLQSFFMDPSELLPEQEHPQCVFPARYKWLDSKLGFDPNRLPRQHCERLEDWLATLDPERITLVFASFYMNNPASMFGHTFLRIDKERDGPDQPLLNYGVNYAAAVDTRHTNALTYSFKGLLGFYRGTFTLFPYYAKVQEYSNWESRDLWEYELNFTKDQIDYFLLHLWELGGNYFDYLYFQENCSYHILSLLEVANPDLHLTDAFVFQVIPTETVKVLVQQPGLVTRRVYRPSILSQMTQKLATMNVAQERALRRLSRDPSAIESAEFGALSPNEQAPVLDAYLDYAQYRSMKANPAENVFTRENRSILLARAKLNVVASDSGKAIEFSTPPELGHGSARVGLGYGGFHRERFEQLTIRPAYHDLMASDVGYNKDSQILFFDTTLRYYPDIEALHLDSLKVLDIISLTPFDPFFRRMSWKLSVGVETIRDLDCGFCNAMNVAYGIGLSYAPTLTAPLLVYGLANAQAQYSGRLAPDYRLGGGGTGGVLWDITANWRVQLQGDYMNFPLGDRSNYHRLAIVQRYAVGRDLDVRLDIGQFNGKSDWSVAINLFF
jgi:hypothetical protein